MKKNDDLQAKLEKELLRTIELQIDPDLAEFTFEVGETIHVGSQSHPKLRSVVFSERGNFGKVRASQLELHVEKQGKKFVVEVDEDGKKRKLPLPAKIDIVANAIFTVQLEICTNVAGKCTIRLADVQSELLKMKN